METVKINHKEYQAKTKNMSISELAYTIKDAKEAIRALPDGVKAGYYADEINYCSMEISKRITRVKKGLEKDIPTIDYIEKKFIESVLSLVKYGMSEENAKVEVKRIMNTALELLNK